jgi:hypothetical protein
LSDLLWQPLMVAASLEHRLTRIQIDPPREADEWAGALWDLDTLLWELAECADAARAGLPEMVDHADVEAARAGAAMRAILTGLRSRAPKPCTHCDGHAGSVEEGPCGHCEGTGIDPTDPEFPA